MFSKNINKINNLQPIIYNQFPADCKARAAADEFHLPREIAVAATAVILPWQTADAITFSIAAAPPTNLKNPGITGRPVFLEGHAVPRQYWWVVLDSNQRPRDYEF